MRLPGPLRRRASGWVLLAVVVPAVLAGCGGSDDGGEKLQEAVAGLAEKDPKKFVEAIGKAYDDAAITVVRTNAADRPLLITAGEGVTRFDYTNEDFTTATQLLAGEDYCVNEVAKPELVRYFGADGFSGRQVMFDDAPWACAGGESRDLFLVRTLQDYEPRLESLAAAAAGGEASAKKTWREPVVEEKDGRWVLHVSGVYTASPDGGSDTDAWLATEGWIDEHSRPVRLLQQQADGRTLTWDITYPDDADDQLVVPTGKDRGAYALRSDIPAPVGAALAPCEHGWACPPGAWWWSDGRDAD